MEPNILVYAYLGDAIYELIIRNYLIAKGFCKVKDLQQESIAYVSAKGQSKFLECLLPSLSEEELAIVKRARNYKRSAHPKHTDILTYKHATAFEALLGYLYKKGDYARITTLLEIVLGENNVCLW